MQSDQTYSFKGTMAKYTDKQKADALKLYEEHGPREVARRTGINKSTITRWAKIAGLRTSRTEKATAAAKANMAEAAEMRSQMVPVMAKAFHDIMQRIYEPHQEFVGQQGKEVRYEKAPAGAVKNYVTSAAILLDKIRLEEGQVTDRTEQLTVSDFDREVAELVEKVRGTALASNGNGVGHRNGVG